MSQVTSDELLKASIVYVRSVILKSLTLADNVQLGSGECLFSHDRYFEGKYSVKVPKNNVNDGKPLFHSLQIRVSRRANRVDDEVKMADLSKSNPNLK